MAIAGFMQPKRGGARALSLVGALFASLFLLTSCTDTGTTDPKTNTDPMIMDGPGPGPIIGEPIIPPPPPPLDDGPIVPIAPMVVVELKMVTTPTRPEDEQFTDDWRVQLFPIDDQGRPLAFPIYGVSDPTGLAAIAMPGEWFYLPLVARAINTVYPPFIESGDDDEDGPNEGRDDDVDDDVANDDLGAPIDQINPPDEDEEGPPDDEENDDDDDANNDEDDFGHWARRLNHVDDCLDFSIFIPPACANQAVWIVGPAENAIWRFYSFADQRRAVAWNSSQIDCGTWLNGLALLISTDRIQEELEDLSEEDDLNIDFNNNALILALQENQEVLVPSRPPVCMAERRHNGGQLNQGDLIEPEDFIGGFDLSGDGDVIIGANGLFTEICDIGFRQSFNLNGTTFVPDRYFELDEEDFDGVISEEDQTVPNIDVEIFQVRQNNGRTIDERFEQDCSVTTLVQFTNLDDENKDIHFGTGTQFIDLFDGTGGGGLVLDTAVYLTSDGDIVVDDEDTWAIFYDTDDDDAGKVITVELPGHRKEDFRDDMYMIFDPTNDNLFVGLRDTYELNQREVDGERAFLNYTVTVWNGDDEEDCAELRNQIADCYEAADPLTRQFFITNDFNDVNCCDGDCETGCRHIIPPLEAAEFAVRSECFSNSRSQQRWQSDDVGFWNINSHHGVAPNVIVPPGWLAPFLNFEIYIQKFDEAVFKGPRTVKTSDDVGQLIIDLPTIVEGDRVLIRSESSCCDDYDVVLPCVPEFVGFAGAPGVPYIPAVLGPPVGVPVP